MTLVANDSSRLRWILRFAILNSLILSTAFSMFMLERNSIQRRLAERELYATQMTEQAVKTQAVWSDWRDRMERKMESIEAKVDSLERKR